MVQGHEVLTLRVFFAYIITTLYPQKELLKLKMEQKDVERSTLQFVESSIMFLMKNFSKQSTSGCRESGGGNMRKEMIVRFSTCNDASRTM